MSFPRRDAEKGISIKSNPYKKARLRAFLYGFEERDHSTMIPA
jgi:hypothetical protein